MQYEQDTDIELVPFVSLADSGGPSRIGTLPWPVVHDLRSFQLGSGRVPLNWLHDDPKLHRLQVGHVSHSLVRGNRLYCYGSFEVDRTGGHPLAGNLVHMLRRGGLLQVSVGSADRDPVPYGEGESVLVNGTVHRGPVLIAVAARFFELAVSPDGQAADEGTFITCLGAVGYEQCLGPKPLTRLELVRLICSHERGLWECEQSRIAAAKRLRLEIQHQHEQEQREISAARQRDQEKRRVNDYRYLIEASRDRDVVPVGLRPGSLADEFAAKRASIEARRDEIRASCWGR